MKLFSLMAFGRMELEGGHGQIPSRRMHTTREAAELERDEFIERVTTAHEKNLDCLSRDGLEIEVFEYELVNAAAGD
jgi:hypothetical protein